MFAGDDLVRSDITEGPLCGISFVWVGIAERQGKGFAIVVSRAIVPSQAKAAAGSSAILLQLVPVHFGEEEGIVTDTPARKPISWSSEERCASEESGKLALFNSGSVMTDSQYSWFLNEKLFPPIYGHVERIPRDGEDNGDGDGNSDGEHGAYIYAVDVIVGAR